ncbi:hypothetical protein [Marinomonas sp. GJ51-6]|uniref:hypothetical protein n=1 Tax=Marinomonas sp. GJ51-6 TaxID=2992802 RepID=UPI0029343BAC|nr:hypothetical protein [Marinomonas sp. GJ51-6]WOD09271.1 hypothetical protein ONZ50_04505 [Marinomonas sp. GJ51-6]
MTSDLLPHGSPDFFTNEDIKTLFETEWEIHYNSSRTGVRLIYSKPTWARKDGGEAGLHPSNIHDNAYAFGSVDFTGDMPVILRPDASFIGRFCLSCYCDYSRFMEAWATTSGRQGTLYSGDAQ